MTHSAKDSDLRRAIAVIDALDTVCEVNSVIRGVREALSVKYSARTDVRHALLTKRAMFLAGSIADELTCVPATAPDLEVRRAGRQD